MGLHIIILRSGILIEPAMGQNMSMLNVASLVGWLISVTMLIASFRLPNTILLPVVYSFTGLIVLLSGLIPSAHVIQISLKPHLLIHISLALFAYACLAIASLYAVQLSYINFRLKEKKRVSFAFLFTSFNGSRKYSIQIIVSWYCFTDLVISQWIHVFR